MCSAIRCAWGSQARTASTESSRTTSCSTPASTQAASERTTVTGSIPRVAPSSAPLDVTWRNVAGGAVRRQPPSTRTTGMRPAGMLRWTSSSPPRSDATTSAVPRVGWPAKGISCPGVKIRTEASPALAPAPSEVTNADSLRLNCRAHESISPSESRLDSGKTQSGFPENGFPATEKTLTRWKGRGMPGVCRSGPSRRWAHMTSRRYCGDMASPDGVVPGNIYLFRHGETEWSLSGQHTGTTDLPLLPEGEAAARELADVLRKHRFERVLVSPLQRARRTAELAGLGDFEVEPLLREWDYGAYEGITTKQISAEIGHPWEVFVDGVRPGVTPGETVEQVSARAQQVIDKVWPDLEHGDVALFGHGHALRVLTATYLGLDPRFGQQLILDAGSMSVLTHHRSTRCLGMYNLSPWRLLSDG